MHRFNVATFVNLLIVGLAATTISLFVFGLPKEDANVRTNKASENVVANVGDAAEETLEETSFRELDGAEEKDAALTEGAVDSLFAEEAVEVEAENDADAVEADAVDALFAEEAVEEAEEAASDSEAEIDDLNSLFAEDAIEETEETEEVAVDSEAVAIEETDEVAADADVEAVAEPLAVEETEEVAADVEVVDLDSLFAEDAIDETAEVAADSEAVAVEEAEEVAADVEVVDLDSLFAEDAIDETAEVAVEETEKVAVESETVAVEETEEVASDVDVVDLDSLFAEDAIEETEKAAVDSEAVAVEEAEEVAIEAEAVSVEEADEVAIETDVADVESEVVDLDSLFADDAIEEAADAEAIAVEENAEVAADAETVAVEENAEVAVDPEAVAVEEAEEVAADVEVVDLDSLFTEDAIEEAAEVAAEPEAVAIEETEEVAIDSETVAVEEAEEVSSDVEVVDLDSLFADDAIEEAAEVSAEPEAVAVEEAEEVAVDSEAVAIEETDEVAEESDVEAIDLDSLFVDDAIDADEEVAVENNSVEVADVDSLFADEAVEDAVVSEEAVETEAVVAEEAVETEAVVAEEAVESAAVVAEEAVENAVVADEIAKVENLADAQAVEPEAFAVSNAPQTVKPENAVAPIRENELWVLGQAGNGFYLYRLEGGAWVAKEVADFYADAAEFATVVYAHGYQTDMTDATRDAAAFKAVLAAARQNVGADRAFRLVVWKWNSERDAARIRVDAQSKASLADWSGKALGRFLGGLDANADFALVGFSFGARVVGSALETLAQNGAQAVALDVEFDENDEFAFAVSGKENVVENVSEPNAVQAAVAEPYLSEASEGRKIALILVAAACDLGSFEARGVYGRGATLPTDVLNVYNPSDFALRYYRHVSETRSDAQGVAPLRSGVFPNAVGKTFNVNSNPALGKRHAFVDAIGTVPTQTIGALAF